MSTVSSPLALREIPGTNCLTLAGLDLDEQGDETDDRIYYIYISKIEKTGNEIHLRPITTDISTIDVVASTKTEEKSLVFLVSKFGCLFLFVHESKRPCIESRPRLRLGDGEQNFYLENIVSSCGFLNGVKYSQFSPDFTKFA